MLDVRHLVLGISAYEFIGCKRKHDGCPPFVSKVRPLRICCLLVFASFPSFLAFLGQQD